MTTEEIEDRRQVRKYRILAALSAALLLASATGMVAAYWQHTFDARYGEDLAYSVKIYRPHTACGKLGATP